MEERRLVFGFYAEGENAEFVLEGDLSEIVSGLVLAITSNHEFKHSIALALSYIETMPDDIKKDIDKNTIKKDMSDE